MVFAVNTATGLLLDRGWVQAYVALMVLGCVGVGVMALALERRIPATVNGVRAPDEERSPAA